MVSISKTSLPQNTSIVIVWDVVSETSLTKQFHVESPKESQTQPLSIPTAGCSSLKLPLESKKLRL